jgi:hypothetical protein
MDKKKTRDYLKDVISREKIQIYDDEQKLDQFIIKESAKHEIADLVNRLSKSLEDKLKSELSKSLPPNFEMVHVREQGLRIWGKEDNVALAKSTVAEIFENFKNVLEPTEFEGILFNTGRRAALSFFDQFREILKIDSVLYITSSIEVFLNLLATFDQRSAWWEELKYDEADINTLSITIKKPFWRYPWFEDDNHYYDQFAAGYLLSLHNSCFDYLHVLSIIKERTFKESFAIEIVPYKERDPLKTYFGLKKSDMKIDLFEDINIAIYLLVEWILFYNFVEDEKDQIFDTIDSLINQIEKIFKVNLEINRNIYQDLKANHSRHHPKLVRSTLYKFLNVIRIQYDDLRRKSLTF